MLFRAIALDIDGTLTNSQKKITSKTRSMLIKFQKNGGKILLASGRPAKGIAPYAHLLRLQEFGGYILAFNGGRVIDCAKNRILFSSSLPLNTLPEICRIIRDYPVGINTYEGDHIIAGQQINRYTELTARINGMEIRFVDNFADYVRFDIPKCLLHGEPDVIAALEKCLVKCLGHELNIFKSEPFFLEIVPRQIDKAQAIDRLLKANHIRQDECIAFGDGFNDISMIRYAGLGVAMSNAAASVREAADYITGSNDEDGIGCLLEQMGRSVFPSLAMI